MYTARVKRRSVQRPRIVARILFICLLSSLLPLLGLAVAHFFAGERDLDSLDELSSQTERELREQGQRELAGRAAALDARLGSTAASVLQLGSYAEEVLRAPEVYGSFHRKPASTGSAAPALTPEQKEQAALAPPDPGQAVDNTLYYVTAKDGALRKALDDKKSAVFFQARTGLVPFTQFDMNRVFATATLDPLLKACVTAEPLVSSAYIITSDNLIRTYPYVDTSGWPADRSFTGLAMYAFSPQKANQDGVVWSSPYVSQITKQWVVACLRGVNIGEKMVAVAGTELALNKLAGQALGFSFGTNALCWLQTTDGVLLSAQTGGDAVLRVIPMGSAELPSEKHPDSKIKAEANINESGAGEVSSALAALKHDSQQLAPVGGEDSARFLGLADLPTVGWQLCGLTEFPALAGMRGEASSEQAAASARLPLLICLAALGVVLGLLAGFMEARRISQPLGILSQRLRRSLASKSAMPVAIAEDGEIGAVAAACQDLVDTAFGTKPPENG